MAETKRLLPVNLADDKNLQSICDAVDKAFNLDSEINKLLVYLIDNVPEDALDFLAWQFHVEGYELATTVEQKRALIKNSIELHRYKGTRYAILKALESLGLSGEIKEWFEYNGEPYKFRVYIKSPLSSEKLYIDLVGLVKQYKNERSWLDSIGISRDVDGNLFFGFSLKSGKLYHVGLHFDIGIDDKHLLCGLTQRKAIKTQVGIGHTTVNLKDEDFFVNTAFRVAKTMQIGVGNG